MAETSHKVRDHFLAALTRRREALPAAARARVDARLEQLRARALPLTVTPAPYARAAANESPLAALVRELEARTCCDAIEADPGAPRELKSAQHFREQLTDFSIARQVDEALAQWPENPGPLNSHFLVLQAFDTLRDRAPRYLRHFVEYLDTLFWLESIDSASPAIKGRVRSRKKRA